MQLKRAHAFGVVLVLLTGCASIIGVPDLTYQESDLDAGGLDGSVDGQTRLDATSNPDASSPNDATADTNPPVTDAGTDSATCDLTKTAQDPLNCGSCGHVCLDDAGCSSSACNATILTTIGGGSLGFIEIIEHGDYLYATPDDFTATAQQGVYRIHKTTGANTLYAPLLHANKMVIVGDTLWITAYTSLYDPSFPSDNGGIYRCKLVAGDTCSVELVTPVAYPAGPNGIGTKIYYADYGRLEFRTLDTAGGFIADGGADAEAFIQKYGATTEIGNLWEMWVDPAAPPTTYFQDAYGDGTVVTYKLNPAGASQKTIGKYAPGSNDAYHGSIIGNASSVYWTSADYSPGTSGALKKINRADDSSCDLANRAAGKNEVVRPQGLFLDSKNVFWTNKGELSAGTPNGSVAMCPVDTCCTDAKFVWNGSGQPYAITGDATHLYWTVYNTGDIYRVTKP